MTRDQSNETFARLNQRWLGVTEDGWAGRGTTEAWRRRTGFEDPAPPSAVWPLPDERSLTDFYGPVGPSSLITITLPYRMRLAWNHSQTVTRTSCHRKVAESLQAALEGILDLYGDLAAVKDARMDLYGGCYNKRPQRGGRSWSLHAWGAAIDLDPTRNRNSWPWPSRGTMPPEVIDIFEALGWKSGARAWGRDAMHFQATR